MTDQTLSPTDLENLLSGLRNVDVEVRHQALSELERLQKEDFVNRQVYFIDKLLEVFNEYQTDSDCCTRLGKCIAKHLTDVANIDFEEQWQTFLQILGRKFTETNMDFADSYLKIAVDTIPKAGDLLNKSRFLYLFLIFLRQNYLSLCANLKRKVLYLLSIMVPPTRGQYFSVFKDSLSVALKLTHMKSKSLRRAVFHLLRTMYVRIAASTDKPFWDCDEETISILLKALSDDCARLYSEIINKDLLISVLITLPASWINETAIDIGHDVVESEACAEEAVILLKYLHLISQSNVQTIEWLLIQQFNLSASLAVFLIYRTDEVTQGCVLCLLDSIISNIKKPNNITTLVKSGLLEFKFMQFLKSVKFIEALVSKDRGKLAQMASEYSADTWDDPRGRSPTEWADYLGGGEVKNFIISNYSTSKDSQTGESSNLEQHRSSGSDIAEDQVIVESQEITNHELRKSLHLLYFTAEILPILLEKYQAYVSQLHRYVVLSLIQKFANNIPRQMLELIMNLKVYSRSISHTICEIMVEAIVDGNIETSKMALLLNQSLQTTLPSVFTSLARKYQLPVQKDDGNLSPPKRAKYEGSSSLRIHDVDSNISNLLKISQGISHAAELSDKEAVMEELKKQFLSLKEVLRSLTFKITSQELREGELVGALFICLAASSCNHWSKSVGGCALEDHFDYLLERRNLFMQIFHGGNELKTLLRLLVDATKEVGPFKIYLPELLSRINIIEKLAVRSADYAKDASLLQGKVLESWFNNKPLQIMEHWFGIIPQHSDLNNKENYLICKTINIVLRSSNTSKVTYLKENRVDLELEHYLTLNQIVLLNSSVIFDTWFSDDRERIAGFRPFYEDLNHFITLKPENTPQDSYENGAKCLQMSVLDWLGRGCGEKAYFLNPALIRLVRMCAFQAGHREIDFESDSFIGRNEIHRENHMKELGEASECDMYDSAIVEGKKMGSRLIIDLGLDLIPSAYCLSCIYDTERERPITSWCLQASNDGMEWINLSLHRNDHRIHGETLVIPLTPSADLSNSRKSYRLFRILDLSPIDRQRRMRVCCLDFFGSIVGIHKQLFDYGTLCGRNSVVEPSLSAKYLIDQMKALKKSEKFLPVKYVSDALMEYDIRSVSQYFSPEICISSRIFDFSHCVNLKTKKRLPPLRFELVARDEEGTTLASVEIDNFNSSIFPYATRLAENLVQRGISFQTRLTLEYFLSDESERNLTTTGGFNRILHLVNLIYQMSLSFSHERNSVAFERHTSQGEEFVSLKYCSFWLRRPIKRQISDFTALGLGLIPHWCDNLDREISLLIPHELRVELLRTCAFGFSRTMSYLRTLKNTEDERRHLRGHFRLPIQPKSVPSLSSSMTNLQLLEAHHVFNTGVCASSSNWRGSIAGYFIELRKDPLDSDDGRAFWAAASTFLNECADLETGYLYAFEGEVGRGEGVNRDFFTELSREFRRKSGFMWLNSSENEDSLFVHTEFGLFPTPYPRHLVPLEVLKRFHILGISIAKAIKEGYLMDLPLSEPLLKMIVSYSMAKEDLGRNKSMVDHPTSNRILGNLEKCWKGIFSSKMFIGHWNLSDTGSRHWLTGLLDVEDFLLLYPHFQSTLPGLLELYRRQRLFLKSTNCCEVEILHEFLDRNCRDIFEVVLDDLCLPMTVNCTSQAKSTRIKLRDVYPWESKDAGASSREDEELEYVNNENYVDYIRRLLEFCLDKGIRAQMEAFVAGFERVFALKWLSMFTSAEAANLISGQLAEKPWSRDELKSYIHFNGFDEGSKTPQYLLDILTGFDVEDRRKFARFVTGCSTLPLGGWQSLSPKVHVMKISTDNGKEYPSSQTCFNILRVNEYASFEELRHDLIIAINNTFFHDF